MELEFTVYWQELLSEIILLTERLLVDQDFPLHYKEDIRSIRKSAQHYSQLLENLSLSNVYLSSKEFLNLILGFGTNPIQGISSDILEDAETIENSSWDVRQYQEVVRINEIGSKFTNLMATLMGYSEWLNAQLHGERKIVDTREFISTITEQFPGTISVQQLDHVFVSINYSQLRYLHRCMVLKAMTLIVRFMLHITISKDVNGQNAKFTFELRNVSWTEQELQNRLKLEYAINNNVLEFLLAKLFVEQHNGQFEYKLDGQQLTYTVYLPLAG